MASIDEKFSEHFHRWELRGRGWQIWPYPVRPEPPFSPFLGHNLRPTVEVDDGRRPTFLSSLVKSVSRAIGGSAPVALPALREPSEPPPIATVACQYLTYQLAIPPTLTVPPELFGQFLQSLSRTEEPLAFELLGRAGAVFVQISAHPSDAAMVKAQLRAFFPDVVITPAFDALDNAWSIEGSSTVVIFEYGYALDSPNPQRLWFGISCRVSHRPNPCP